MILTWYLEMAICVLALAIAGFLFYIMYNNKALVERINNIYMEGKVDDKNINTVKTSILYLSIVLVMLLMLLTVMKGSQFTITQTQTVNINTQEVESEHELIDINKATIGELMLLDGVGENKAANIIEYRNNKEFERVSELINVVGETTYNNIKDDVSVGESDG